MASRKIITRDTRFWENIIILPLYILLFGYCTKASAAWPSLPDSLYVMVTSDGKYTMLADSNNKVGMGETVEIPQEYLIGRYAVTNEEWSAFIISTRHSAPRYWQYGKIPEGRERHPVLWVTYGEAQQYCEWLEKEYPNYCFRLPTQAEWEYAAIGQKRTLFPWGNESGTTYADAMLTSKFNFNAVIAAEELRDTGLVATYNNPKSTRYGEQELVSNIISISSNGAVSGWIKHDTYTGFVYTDLFATINDAGGNTCAVDAYPQGVGPWGCYNMSGNCWEWTSTIETAANGAERGKRVNVIKGGSWYATLSSCRISYRGEGRKPDMAYATVGFRVVAVPK